MGGGGLVKQVQIWTPGDLCININYTYLYSGTPGLGNLGTFVPSLHGCWFYFWALPLDHGFKPESTVLHQEWWAVQFSWPCAVLLLFSVYVCFHALNSADLRSLLS